MVYSKKGKGALKVAVSSHKEIMNIVVDMMNRSLTGHDYVVESKEIKK